MTKARALAAGPGALRALSSGRGGRVELVGAHGAYLRLGGQWLVLAEPGAAHGPLSLIVSGLEPRILWPGCEARVRPGALSVGGHALRLERLRERRACSVSPAGRADAGAVGAAAREALALLPSAPEALRPGLTALAEGRTRVAVRLLAGVGEGLTPAGDDALAGYAAWCAAVQRPSCVSRLAGRRCHPIGLAYLRCAERGELADGPARMLGAILAGSIPDVRSAQAATQRWGASSGSALVWGMAAAVQRITRRSSHGA